MIFHESVLQGINDLLRGGYMRASDKCAVAYAFFGKRMTGKTTLLLEETYAFMGKTKQSALWVDTEFDKEAFIYFYDKELRERYKVPDECKIYILAPMDWADIIKMHGSLAGLKRSEKTGKVMVEYYADEKIQDPKDKRRKVSSGGQIEEMIKKHNIGLLVYDSLTVILKGDFVGGRKNFPTRDDAGVMLMLRILRLAIKYHLVVFATHHATIPIKEGYVQPDPDFPGGAIIQYLSKVWFYLELTQYKTGPLRGIRRVYLVRFFKSLSWARKFKVILTDDGWKDITDEDIERIREDYQAEQKAGQRALLEKTKSKKKRG